MTEREIFTLFEAYHYDVYRFAYSFAGSRQDAEDITQGTFLKMMETHPQLQAGKEKVHLHYYEGYTMEEIAEMLKISSSGVSMRPNRARKRLKQFLEENIF